MPEIDVRIEFPKIFTEHGIFLRFNAVVLVGGLELLSLRGMRAKRDGTLVPAQRAFKGGGLYNHWELAPELDSFIVGKLKLLPIWRQFQATV